MCKATQGPLAITMGLAGLASMKLLEPTASRARKELEANRREAELTRELEVEDEIIKREKAAKNTGIAVDGEGPVPKSFRADEFVISTPTREITDAPVMPEG